MAKKPDFKKIEWNVIKVLESNPMTREDDMLLYYYVCDKMMKARYGDFHTQNLTFFEMATGHKIYGMPSYESVSRARRKIVYEKRPDLQSKRVTQARKEQEPAYKEYAIT